MDGNVQAMSLAERGAYITLLCICWQEQSLPDDELRLARMVGLPLSAFNKLWPAVQKCFTLKGDAYLHKRLDQEREKQEIYRRRQSDKGKASANRRATERQPEGNRGSTGVQPDTQPKGNSPISDLRSPDFSQQTHVRVVPKIQDGVSTELAERAGRLVERYEQLYSEKRKGAKYLRRQPALDWDRACRLCRTWDDARLEKMAVIFLTTDDDWISHTDRGFAVFESKATWCDERLAAWEAQQKRSAS